MVPGLGGQWQMAGVVAELRELLSKKNADWRGWIIKIATLGHSFEVQVTQEVFGQFVVGEEINASGHLEEQGGRLRLIADKCVKKPGKVSA